MKKLISFVLVIVLALSMVAAMAEEEEFSVRNGIKFGMTLDEVKAIEAANGNENGEEFGRTISYENVSVAGYPGTSIEYWFDDGSLFQIVYFIGDDTDDETEEFAAKAVSELATSLEEKYGEPAYAGGKVVAPTRSEKFDSYIGQGMFYKIPAFSEWLIKKANGYVNIDLFLLCKLETMYSAILVYNEVDDELIESIEQAEEEKQKQRDNDL